MGYIQGEGRNQGTLFPVALDDFVPADHMCRVIDAFVEKLMMSELGFERAQAAETGRPGYDPRDLLKLYLYGYLNQIRSSRRLEVECRRNVELMWLLGRLYPDHKSIAEFRRMHRDAVTRDEAAAVAAWIAERSSEGVMPHEFGVFVRSDAELERARAAIAKTGLPSKTLDNHVETTSGQISVGTMHLAKGLEISRCRGNGLRRRNHPIAISN
jgi:transposase